MAVVSVPATMRPEDSTWKSTARMRPWGESPGAARVGAGAATCSSSRLRRAATSAAVATPTGSGDDSKLRAAASRFSPARPTVSFSFQRSTCSSRLRNSGLTQSVLPGLAASKRQRTCAIAASSASFSGEARNAATSAADQLQRSASNVELRKYPRIASRRRPVPSIDASADAARGSSSAARDASADSTRDSTASARVAEIGSANAAKATASAARTSARLELRLFGRAAHRGDRGIPAADRLRHVVEVAGPDLALVLGRGVTHGLRRELRLLQGNVGAHLRILVSARQLEHREVESVESRQRDELELVTHGTEFALEPRDRRVVELLPPVEGRRAIVGEQIGR